MLLTCSSDGIQPHVDQVVDGSHADPSLDHVDGVRKILKMGWNEKVCYILGSCWLVTLVSIYLKIIWLNRHWILQVRIRFAVHCQKEGRWKVSKKCHSGWESSPGPPVIIAKRATDVPPHVHGNNLNYIW